MTIIEKIQRVIPKFTSQNIKKSSPKKKISPKKIKRAFSFFDDDSEQRRYI